MSRGNLARDIVILRQVIFKNLTHLVKVHKYKASFLYLYDLKLQCTVLSVFFIPS
jgi:hypothetical protein